MNNELNNIDSARANGLDRLVHNVLNESIGFKVFLIEYGLKDAQLKTLNKNFELFIYNVAKSFYTVLGDMLAFVLICRYELSTGIARTLDNIGVELGFTRERIRQIEKRAKRLITSKLKNIIIKAACVVVGIEGPQLYSDNDLKFKEEQILRIVTHPINATNVEQFISSQATNRVAFLKRFIAEGQNCAENLLLNWLVKNGYIEYSLNLNCMQVTSKGEELGLVNNTYEHNNKQKTELLVGEIAQRTILNSYKAIITNWKDAIIN